MGRAGSLAKPPVASGVAVPVREVRLDVQDGGAVYQVCATDMEHRAQGVRVRDVVQPHRGEADGIGPEGGAAGKDSHPLIASQPGRPDCGGPFRPLGLVKGPDQPDVGESLQPPQGVRIAVGLLEHHGGLQRVHQTALTRDAELGAEVAADAGDGAHFKRIRHEDSSFLRQVFSPLYRIFPGKPRRKGKAPVQCTGAFADPYQ